MSRAPLLGVAVAAGLLWASSRMTWVRMSSDDGLGVRRDISVLGSTWFGALTPLALALLASIAAVLAARGRLRQLFGAVIALIGGAAAVPPIGVLTGSGVSDSRAAALADLPGRAQVMNLHASALPASVALAGALVAFAAGVWLARTPSGGGLSSKYTAPAARRERASRDVADFGDGHVASERVLWDALDAGEDPTR